MSKYSIWMSAALGRILIDSRSRGLCIEGLTDLRKLRLEFLVQGLQRRLGLLQGFFRKRRI